MKTTIYTSIFLLISFFSLSQPKNLNHSDTFKSVTIGKQEWMSENLNVSTFRNGDPIPEAKTNEEWKNAGENMQPAWCYYDNDPKNGAKYGKLYNWFAVNDSRGLAPEGWHVPTYEDWETLKKNLGENLAKKMKSTNGWNSYTTKGYVNCPNCASWSAEYRGKVACHTCKDTRRIDSPNETHSGNGTNSSGFNGLPGGYRSGAMFGGTSSFQDVGKIGRWWFSTDEGKYSSKDIRLEYNYGGDAGGNPAIKDYGLSVRCIRN